MKIEINKKPKSTVEIVGEIDATTFETYRENAFKELGKDYEIDGFRKGTVPKSLLEQKIPEMYILEEMAQMAIQDVYPKILDEHKIKAIGQPAVQIKKIAKGNPLEFSIMCATIPEVTLPDYKKLAQEVTVKKVDTVEDTEVENTINQILEMRSHDGHEHTGEESPDHTHEKPELTDEYVKTLGDFTSVEDFKNKLKENILLEKNGREQQKARQQILDSILSKSNVEVPDMLVEYELDRFMDTMKADIERMGLKYEEYLKHLTKTEEEMREEYRAETEKKVQTEFILREIAQKENIKADPEEVKKQMEVLKSTYKDINEAHAIAYVEDMLEKEAVIKFLENR